MEINRTTYHSNRCLSAEELRKYNKNLLSSDEKYLIDEHLQHCDFCKDAVEGYSYLKRNNLENKVALLNNRIRRRSSFLHLKKGVFLFNPNFHQVISYASIAASIVIVLGTMIYVNYSWRKYSEQLANEYIEKNKITTAIIAEKTTIVERETVQKGKTIIHPVSKSDKKGKNTETIRISEDLAVFESENKNLEESAEISDIDSYSEEINKPNSISAQQKKEHSEGFSAKKRSTSTKTTDAISLSENENYNIIPPTFKGGEEKFIKKITRGIKTNQISLPKENIVLHFTVSKSGNIENIKILNEITSDEKQKIIGIILKQDKWQPATQNDQFIDYEIEIIVPLL